MATGDRDHSWHHRSRSAMAFGAGDDGSRVARGLSRRPTVVDATRHARGAIVCGWTRLVFAEPDRRTPLRSALLRAGPQRGWNALLRRDLALACQRAAAQPVDRRPGPPAVSSLAGTASPVADGDGTIAGWIRRVSHSVCAGVWHAGAARRL